MKKISIITINYNNAEGLKKTINSVQSQTCLDYEFIIVDGGSSDDSPNIIAMNAASITKWVSETDSGIYNAMNKGIAMATGLYCLFLNSGDYLFQTNALALAYSFLTGGDIVGANPVYIYGARSVEVVHPAKVTKDFMLKTSLPHQATFIKRSLFNNIGLYNEKNKIVSDWEFFLEALFIHNCSFTKIPFPLAVFNRDGMSYQPENRNIYNEEQLEVIERILPAEVENFKTAKRSLKQTSTAKKVKRTCIRLLQALLRLFGVHKEFIIAQL